MKLTEPKDDVLRMLVETFRKVTEQKSKGKEAMATSEERSLERITDTVHRADVVHHDGKIMIPNDMEIDEVIDLLRERQDYLSQEMQVNRDYDAFPWDGALALQRVFTERYGWVPSRMIPGMFGNTPPQTISVEVAYKQTEQVPWGRFKIPGVNGTLTTTYQKKNGRAVFAITGEIIRKDERLVNEILDDIQRELNQGSIYLGQAISIRFFEDDGEEKPIPDVKFIDASVGPENLILSEDLHSIVETNLLTPVRRARDCAVNGIQVKRGVLLGGEYGTGKTLAAAVAAHEAVANDVTYLYVPRADELAHAIRFARQYDDPACVVFCEDIDRVMHGERNVHMDDLLNVIDGIDGKDSNIIVVLTTNFLEEINQAMLRPGRLDAVIEITAPDAKAVEQLLRYYGGGAIPLGTDLRDIGRELAGNIPAIIAEVVKRAKLAELRRTEPGELIKHLSEEALMEAAKTMTKQLGLLEKRDPVVAPTLDNAMGNVVRQAFQTRRKRTSKAGQANDS
jgi:transitional endoplasmic reticulum ATPase